MKKHPGQINVFQNGLLATLSLGLNGNARQRRTAKRRLERMGYEIETVFSVA